MAQLITHGCEIQLTKHAVCQTRTAAVNDLI